MARYGSVCTWILGAAVLTYGCTNTTPGTGTPNGGNGNGGNKNGGSLLGTGTATGESPGNGNGNGNGNGSGTVAGNGARESSLFSLQQAVLTSYGGSGGNCAAKAGASACTTCALQNCCLEATTCAEYPACISLGGCLAECNDNDCVAQCTHQYPEYAATFQDLMSCAIGSCKPSCD